MKAYCTKYALTEGILVLEGEIVSGTDFVVKTDFGNQYFHGKDWHLTLASAKDRAEDMRQRKIVSVKKSLARLEALTFDKPKGEEIQ